MPLLWQKICVFLILVPSEICYFTERSESRKKLCGANRNVEVPKTYLYHPRQFPLFWASQPSCESNSTCEIGASFIAL